MTDSFLVLFGTGLLLMSVLMLLLWLAHFPLKKASIVDVGWGLGMGLLGISAATLATGWFPRRLMLGALAGVWGGRLAWHLATRMLAEAHEDGRYLALRDRWKTSLPQKFFLFFQAQAVLATCLCFPFFLICLNPTPSWTVFDIAGGLLCLFAVFGESLADYQLRTFKAIPANRGSVCDRGLWAWSRHPNYFFEWLIWVGVAVIALGTKAGAVSILCPLVMLFFLLRVTGIPVTEAWIIRSKGKLYSRYQEQTSAFVPMPSSVNQWLKAKTQKHGDNRNETDVG